MAVPRPRPPFRTGHDLGAFRAVLGRPGPFALAPPGALCHPAAMPKTAEVYTLLVEVGRRPGDGLPEGATGAALMCYASGCDEAEAVRETVAVLKRAEMAPLDVSSYGSLAERLADGHDVAPEERALMERAAAEDAVIVAQATPFYDVPETPSDR